MNARCVTLWHWAAGFSVHDSLPWNKSVVLFACCKSFKSSSHPQNPSSLFSTKWSDPAFQTRLGGIVALTVFHSVPSLPQLLCWLRRAARRGPEPRVPKGGQLGRRASGTLPSSRGSVVQYCTRTYLMAQSLYRSMWWIAFVTRHFTMHSFVCLTALETPCCARFVAD